ncbi:hypothetical protein NDU88_000759 [Pleurodeles waltl]|uniref:DUF4455 domain-containing protein n=1 Tax=Pleurodeles waltl TaxID=8319 RepID=A0AAV7Q182_PLEWA|nr:hypothetical protein NDU88_000759 [Pleurodeles waltl]
MESDTQEGKQQGQAESGKTWKIALEWEDHKGNVLALTHTLDTVREDGKRELETRKAQKTEESEAEIAAQEVRDLANIIVPESSDRGIIQHVADRRQERHEAAVTDLQQELVRISKEMEPSVLRAGKELQKKLAFSDRTNQLLENSTDLATLTMKMINQAILANRRAVMKLALNLTEADLKREGALRLRWQDRMKEWKLAWKDTTLNKFSNLLPPTCTKSQVADWYSSLMTLNKTIDCHNVQFVNLIRVQHEKRTLERLAMQTDLQNKDLFKFTQGAAHLWDVLEISLSKQEKGLQRKLDDCQQHHARENQVSNAAYSCALFYPITCFF